MEEGQKQQKPKLLQDLGMQQRTEYSLQKKRFGIYECPFCSKEFEAQSASINSGNTKSCGCLRPKKSGKGRPTSQTEKIDDLKVKLYGVYISMKQRCYDKNHPAFKNYGGRGIKVYDEWLSNFELFQNWALQNGFILGLTLDRIDSNGNYAPLNCRWVDRATQAQNTRHTRENNTSGYRGVSYYKNCDNWVSYINVEGKRVNLGYYQTALEAAKAYETYVRLNNLEHNFTPALAEEEIEALNLRKG